MHHLYRSLDVSRVLLVLSGAVVWLLTCLGGMGSYAQESVGPCEPGLARGKGAPRITFVAATRVAETPPEAVTLAWLGHSSFLLTSPQGVRIVTDPHPLHRPAGAVDAVTVSNLHVTHRGVQDLAGSPRLLWGITSERAWNSLALTIGDVTLFNVPSYTTRTDPEQSPIHNSMFVFRLGGLCIAHLGNLRHPLTPAQLQRIGTVDVLMVPVDGGLTLSFEEVLAVIAQLRPLLVIPMHIDLLEQAQLFVQSTHGRYPVHPVPARTLVLTRQLLPATTTLVLFGKTP